MVSYQPFRGQAYQRDCESRYEPIHELCSRFTRQFSVLDIGCNHAWFGHRLVNDFDCVYVGIDNKEIDAHPRIWHIKGRFNGGTYLKLSDSEHFDVVLGLAVLHHIPDYRDAFRAIRQLGWNAFVEVPGPGDRNAANPGRHDAIQSLFEGLDPIAHFASHVSDSWRPCYLLESPPHLVRQSMDADQRGAPGYATYHVTSDFDTSRILIDRKQVCEVECRPFIPGMNLHNFRLLGGRAEVPADDGHTDHQPWNYIIGDGIKPIDTWHYKGRGHRR